MRITFNNHEEITKRSDQEPRQYLQNVNIIWNTFPATDFGSGKKVKISRESKLNMEVLCLDVLHSQVNVSTCFQRKCFALYTSHDAKLLAHSITVILSSSCRKSIITLMIRCRRQSPSI